MNKIFKVIWNHATQSWIVTSEISKSHGKTASSKSGGFAISHISGVRFAYTAIASTLLILSGQVVAATGLTSGLCYFHTDSQTVICGNQTTSAPDVYGNATSTNPTRISRSIALGLGAKVGDSFTRENSTDTTMYTDAVAIGTQATANGFQSTAIGAQSSTSRRSTAIGYDADAGGYVTTVAPEGELYGVAVGYKAKAPRSHSVAIGAGATVNAFATTDTQRSDAVLQSNVNNGLIGGTTSASDSAGAVAIGREAKAGGYATIAQGLNANASAAFSTAIGANSIADKMETIAIGSRSEATGHRAIAIGSAFRQAEATVASGDNSIAMGAATNVSGANTSVIGSKNVPVDGKTLDASGGIVTATKGTSITATNSSIIGTLNKIAVSSVTATNPKAAAALTDVQVQGNNNTINRGHAYVFGSNNTINTNTTNMELETVVAVGYQNTVSGNNSLAVGRSNTVSGLSALAVGSNSQALGTDAIALGNRAYANEAENAIALGGLTHAGQFGTALGARTSVEGDQGAAVATGAVVKGPRAVAVGSYSFAGTEDAVALGHNAAATGSRAVAIGAGSVVSGARSGAWGIATNGGAPDANTADRSFVGGTDSYAIGNKNIIGNTSSDSFVLGNNVKLGATGASIAITNVAGKDSTTNASTRTNTVNYTGATAITGAVALGSDTSVAVNNGVALGKSSVAGTAAGQVGADPLSAVTNKTSAVWTSTLSAVSVGDIANNKTRQITSVAAGTQDTDAVNVAQLKAAGFTLAASNAGGGESTTVANDKIQNGETVTVDAGKNIKVTHTANTVSIATKDDVAFTTVTTTDVNGNKTVLNGTGVTITPTGGGSIVSLTNVGLNNGGNKITNVADGSMASGSKEAVNGGQLYTIDQKVIANTTNIAKGLNFAGNSGTFNRKLGETTTISGGLTSGSSSNTNIRTVATNGTIDIQLANAPVFTGKVSAQGLDAGNQKITGVQAGQNTTDAVNVGQLNTAIANVVTTTQTILNQNSPFSYIGTVNGDKVALLRSVDEAGDAHFFLADGSNTPYTGDVTISALNPNEPQLSVSTTVGNIADGKADNDAVNVSQLKNAVTALGGGAVVNADGSITKPTYTVVNNTFDNVGGAIDALNTEVQKPLTFAGDSGVNVERKLGTTVNVVGGVTDTTKLTDDNIGIVADGTDTLTVKLAKNIDLGVDGSVTTGDTKVDNAGVTITSTSTGKTPVSLTNAGLDNGGNVISNVGAGKANTDAVNVSQLTPLATALGVNVDPNSGIVAAPSFVVTKTDGSTYAGETTIQGALDNIGTEIQKGITFTGNSGQAVKKLGETFNIKGTLSDTATASDKNIRTEVDSNGVMSIKLAESPKFGNVTINDAGKITGVTAGTADTDAVNVAQLNDKTATTSLTVGNTGVVDTLATTDANKLATAGDIANAINSDHRNND